MSVYESEAQKVKRYAGAENNKQFGKFGREIINGIVIALVVAAVAGCYYYGAEVYGMAHQALDGIIHATSAGVNVNAPDGLIEQTIQNLGIKPGLSMDELMVSASVNNSFDAFTSGVNQDNPISTYLRGLLGGR